MTHALKIPIKLLKGKPIHLEQCILPQNSLTADMYLIDHLNSCNSISLQKSRKVSIYLAGQWGRK